MRVDPNYIQNLSSAISQGTSNEATLTNELSSGLAVSQVGDNPVAATQSLQLGADISQGATFVQSASQQAGVLQVTDTTLGEVVTQLTQAVTLATQGANGTLNNSERSAIALELQGIQGQVLTLANTSYLGQYLFSGSQGSTQPFTLSGSGSATYAGDSVQQTVQTPGGQNLVTNVSGASVFTATGASVFDALSTVISDLTNNTALTAGDSTQLTAALTNVNSQRSVIDSSLSRLQATSTYTQTQDANLTAQQSTLLSTNPATVASQLQSTETQQEALLNVVATLGKGSLFDYLK
jgi:flagellar hook-associated protein 3 FlgL